jgi:hypothetical protein
VRARGRTLAWIAAILLAAGTGTLPAAEVRDLLDKGTRLYDQGKYNKALRVFLKAKQQEPDNLLARDYISRCTDRIVEKETGDRLKRAVRKGEAPIVTIEPGQAAPSWVAPARLGTTRPVGRVSGKKTNQKAGPAAPPIAGGTDGRTAEAVRLREDLIDNFKTRKLEGSLVRIERRRGLTEIIVTMNRVFLPFSDQVAPDAVAELERLARELRAGGEQTVVLRAADLLTPAVRHQMLDLPSRRAAILFSYFAHAALGNPPRVNPVTLTADDLDD